MRFSFENLAFKKESKKYKSSISEFIKSQGSPADFEGEAIRDVGSFIEDGLDAIIKAPEHKERFYRADDICELYFESFIDIWKINKIDMRHAAAKMLITIQVLNHLIREEEDEKSLKDLELLRACYKGIM